MYVVGVACMTVGICIHFAVVVKVPRLMGQNTPNISLLKSFKRIGCAQIVFINSIMANS